MAKRPTRSQVNDVSGATPSSPSPRRARRPRAAAAAEPSASATDAERPEAVTSESVSMASEPSEEDIRLRAYHRYLERGGSQGTDFEDWLEAERELRNR